MERNQLDASKKKKKNKHVERPSRAESNVYEYEGFLYYRDRETKCGGFRYRCKQSRAKINKCLGAILDENNNIKIVRNHTCKKKETILSEKENKRKELIYYHLKQ